MLFSVLALSLIERTPESMGEETVQSISKRGIASVSPESVTRGGAKPTTREVAESGAGSTMSVTGRMVGDRGSGGGVEESVGGVGAESMGGGGAGGGETSTGVGEVGEAVTSLIQGGVEANCGDWESVTWGVGKSVVEGIDVGSSTISNSTTGMSDCALMEGGGSAEMLQSVIGTGEGAGDGGALSCIDGVGESAIGPSGCSNNGGSNFRAMLSVSSPTGFGDSNVELGGGSMMGVVQINKEAGTDWESGGTGESGEVSATGGVAGSVEGECPVSSSSISGSTESRIISGGFSALVRSGSVTQEALCKGVEDSRCSLLACMTPSFPSAVMGLGDNDETE